MMKSLTRKHIWQLGGLLAVDVLLFSYTNATVAPSYVVMIGFLLLTLTLYQLIYSLLSLSSLYGVKIKRQRPLAAYLTAVVGGLIALQSIGELSPRDVLVLLPLAILGYIYSVYAKTIRRNLSG